MMKNNVTKSALSVFLLLSSLHSAENSVNLEAIVIEAPISEEIGNGSGSFYKKEELGIGEVDSFDELSTFVPSFSVTNYGSRNIVFTSYRGHVNFMTTGSPVAVYIDDIPISYVNTFLAHDLYDISDVTVMKGPQGFTTGLGAQAGIIRLQTDTVIPSEPETTVKAGLANYNEHRLSLHTKVPIDNGGVQFNALYSERDGFTKNNYNNTPFDDEQTKAASLKLTKDYDHLNFTLLALFDRNDDGGTPYVDNRDTPFEMNQNIKGFVRQKNRLASFTIEYSDTGLTVKSVTSIQNFSCDELLDGDRTPENLLEIQSYEHLEQFSEALSLTLEEENWELISGVFYASQSDYTYTERHDYDYLDTEGFREWSTSQPETNMALFGTYKTLLDQNWVLSMGLRYNVVEKEFDNRFEQSFPIVIPEYGFVNTAYPPIYDTKTWHRVLPKLNLAYHFNTTDSIFIQYAQGFKSGGYSYDDYDPQTVAYEPEDSKTVELGMSLQWGRSLFLSGSFYATRVDNLQVETTRPDFSSYIDNSSKAEICGLESELHYLLSEHWTLESGLALTRSEFREYISHGVDYSGNTLIHVPKYTVHLGTHYDLNDRYYINASVKSNGKTYFDKANTLSQSSYAVADAKIGYASKPFEWSIYAKNIFDKRYLTHAISKGDESAYNFGEPRRIGLNLTYYFD